MHDDASRFPRFVRVRVDAGTPPRTPNFLDRGFESRALDVEARVEHAGVALVRAVLVDARTADGHARGTEFGVRGEDGCACRRSQTGVRRRARSHDETVGDGQPGLDQATEAGGFRPTTFDDVRVAERHDDRVAIARLDGLTPAFRRACAPPEPGTDECIVDVDRAEVQHEVELQARG